MRQVPHTLLIGNGRVAQHFRHYFSLLGLQFSTWQRDQSVLQLEQQLPTATHVLILISDQEIEGFIAEHLKNTRAVLIHFSGSLVSSQAYGAHPLMTFNSNVYDLDQYKAITFVVDDDAPSFEDLLPGLSNSHVRLAKSMKAKYHALCVLSGNFSCLLWQKLFSSLEQEFQFPAEIAHGYLKQQTSNLLQDAKSALTGPLVRGDVETLEKNIHALKGDPFQQVYESFVKCYQMRTT